MNPDMIDIARACLERGYRVLILTNAMRPMMRKSVQAGLLALHKDYGARMVLRISLDHFDPDKHEAETWQRQLRGDYYRDEMAAR